MPRWPTPWLPCSRSGARSQALAYSTRCGSHTVTPFATPSSSAVDMVGSGSSCAMTPELLSSGTRFGAMANPFLASWRHATHRLSWPTGRLPGPCPALLLMASRRSGATWGLDFTLRTTARRWVMCSGCPPAGAAAPLWWLPSHDALYLRASARPSAHAGGPLHARGSVLRRLTTPNPGQYGLLGRPPSSLLLGGPVALPSTRECAAHRPTRPGVGSSAPLAPSYSLPWARFTSFA